MLRRILQCLSFLSLVSGMAAAREGDDHWIRGVYTGESPRPQQVSEPEARARAAEVARQNPGTFVILGTGESMEPLYSPGTLLVLRQIPYAELKRGQTVLYRSQDRKIVAHVLVAKARDGWRVQGLNNRIHDMEPVQAGNLVGVVVAAFKPAGTRPAMSLATLNPAGSRAN